MIELNFSMPIEIMQANPKVRANIGKVVITGEAGWDDAHIDLSAKSSNLSRSKLSPTACGAIEFPEKCWLGWYHRPEFQLNETWQNAQNLLDFIPRSVNLM